ncbi:PilZ domain-containing protein [bacterium]|nr:PilZ domain-containing protein [bacterium]
MANVQVNQQISILLNTPDGEKIISSYIREVYSDRLVLNQPQNWEENLSFLEEGEEIRTKIFTRSGVLLYTSVVLNSPVDDNFTIEYNEEFANILQRRVFTRVPMETIVDCEYEKLVSAKPVNTFSGSDMVEFSTPLSCEFETEVIEAETVDIGGGGLKIVSSVKLPVQKTITFKINLFDDIIVAKGLVIEKNNLPENQYGIKFTEISEEDKDKIIKTCFRIDGILNRKSD